MSEQRKNQWPPKGSLLEHIANNLPTKDQLAKAGYSSSKDFYKDQFPKHDDVDAPEFDWSNLELEKRKQ